MTPVHDLKLFVVILFFVSFEDSRTTEISSLPVRSASRRSSQEANCRFWCLASGSKTRLNKVRLSEGCARECAHGAKPDKLKEDGEQALSVKKSGALISPISRLRRSVHEECSNLSVPPEYVAKQASRIRVDYTRSKPNITVTWDPIEASDNFYNWTSYALRYMGGSLDYKFRCKLVPKHQNEWTIIHGDGWRYPNTVFLAVVTFPFNQRYSKITLDGFGPVRPPPPPPPTTHTPKNTAKVMGAIAGGSAAGFVLLLLFVFIFRKEIHGFFCSARHRASDDGQSQGVVNARINNFPSTGVHREQEAVLPRINNIPPPAAERYYACYFPEDEMFKVKVASIVNYLRENGYQVVMDIMDSNELINLGPTRWGVLQVKKANKILVFLSPGLLRMSRGDNEGMQGLSQQTDRVWYEMSVLRNVYAQTHSAARMVCISLADIPVDHCDLPLWAELRYKWPEDAKNILKRLNDRPLFMPL